MTRRALCVGVSYDEAFAEHPDYTLSSTLQDVDNFSNLLINSFGYEAEDVTVLKDDGESTPPTRQNILNSMYELGSSADQGDHLVFYFAGHGSQDEEGDGVSDEKDQIDEAIWPSDVQPVQDDGSNLWTSVQGHILDDEIRQYLVNTAISRGAHLVVIFDCCHSGTAADLDDPSYSRPAPRKRAFRFGNIFDANVMAVSWAACQDPQITIGGPDSGIFTEALVAVMQDYSAYTHQQVVDQIRDTMANSLEGNISALSWEQQEKVRAYFQENCTPQVEFLNDDRTLLDHIVEPTFSG